MRIFLMILMLLSSLVLIASVLLQPGNSDGLAGAIAGGAEQLFGKKKSSTIEVIAEKATIVSAIAFIALALIIVAITE